MKNFKEKEGACLTETRTNAINLNHLNETAGYYQAEAFYVLQERLSSEEIGEMTWFDIMIDDENNMFAVCGEDSLTCDSTCYYIEVQLY